MRRSLHWMCRWLVASVAAGLLLCAATPAVAQGKPKIAILGLEVVEEGTLTPQSANSAKLITQKLREAVIGGPYQLAPNSAQDLLELKLLSNCSDEALACMTEIGRGLRADLLLYGKLERQADGYAVRVQLLNLKTGQFDKESTEFRIPFRDAQSAERVTPHVSRIYRIMSGQPAEGTVVVRVGNAESGVVYIDGAPHSLAAGAVTIRGVTQGTRVLTVEAPGFEPYRERIEVAAEGTVTREIELVSLSGDGEEDGGSGRGLTKALFWTATAATVGAAGSWVVFGSVVRTNEEERKNERDLAIRECDAEGVCPDGFSTREEAGLYLESLNDDGGANGDACAAAEERSGGAFADIRSACKTGKRAALIGTVSAIGTGVFALTAVYLGYRAYFASDEPSYEDESAAKRRKREERRTQVAPIIGPNVMGAGLSIEF